MSCYSLTHVADQVLLRDLATLCSQDRSTIATLLAHIAEVDYRKLYLPAAYSSMHFYCAGELLMSEDTAFRRIGVARVARQFPAIFPALKDGRLNMTAVLLLAPHLSPETADELLAAAELKTKDQIRRMLAERFPQPDLPTLVQALVPAATSGQLAPGPVATIEPIATSLAPERVDRSLPTAIPAARPRLTPLSPGRFGWQLTVNQHTQDQADYARAMLGHTIPSGDMEALMEQAMDALVEKLERRKFAKCTRSRPRRGAPKGRYVPAEVRRAIFQRDEGRCTFASNSGKRCEATCRLEFDHIEPIAKGGQSTVKNMRLRCRAHNQYAADCAFGAGFMHEKREQARRRADTRAKAKMQAATVPAKDPEVIPWLRQLGFNATEANRGATLCASIAEAPLEQRLHLALRELAPRCARRAIPMADPATRARATP